MKLQELKEARKKGVEELAAIAKAAELGGERAFTDTERARIKELREKDKEFIAAQKSLEEDAALRAEIDTLATTGTGRQSVSNTSDVSQPLPAEPKKDEKARGFRDHKEFLLSVMRAGQGLGIDSRLRELYRAGGTESLTVGSDEGRGISDPAGGYLIPTAFVPELLQIRPEDDPIGGLTTKVPMATPTIKMPARVDKNHTSSVSGGLTVTRRPETVAATASQMTFEQVTLTAASLFGLAYATEEILVDSPISFAAILAAGFSDQFTSHLINERLNGTGVGEFLGIMTALDASSLGPTVSVAKETGQLGVTLVWENIVKMRAQCWGYGKAVWLANYDTLPQLMLLNQSVGTGGSAMIWQPSARDGEPDRLLGRPLIFTEYAKTLGTTGDIVLGNWGEYLEGTYQSLQNAESMHVRFVNHERAFKFWLRNAGAPWWRTALTTKNSSTKLSPFVILAVRA